MIKDVCSILWIIKNCVLREKLNISIFSGMNLYALSEPSTYKCDNDSYTNYDCINWRETKNNVSNVQKNKLCHDLIKAVIEGLLNHLHDLSLSPKIKDYIHYAKKTVYYL